MKYGEMRSGPAVAQRVGLLDDPDQAADRRAEDDPDPVGSKPFRPESASASLRRAEREQRRCGRAGAAPWAPRGRPGRSPSPRLRSAPGSPSASKARIQSIPLCPATAARQVARRVVPDRRDRPEPGDHYPPHGESLERGRSGSVRRAAESFPFPPMEAELVDELPSGDWQYEPKWDGFRGVLENLGGGLRLWSRNGRPLLRYFPELEEVGELLPPESALDGEIIIVARRAARVRPAPAAPPSGGEPDQAALGGDPGRVRRVRHARLERGSRCTSCR